MREFGISLTLDKEGDKELLVYYTPMTYLDWVRYTDNRGIADPDPPVIRHIFNTYVTRAHIKSLLGGELNIIEMSTYDLAEMGPAVVNSIVEHMASKCGFNDDDKFGELVSALELKSRTLLGSYDYFLFVHLGMDGYLRALELDGHTRAQLIMIVQKATGIDVLQRFRDSLDFNIPLDIMTDPVKYESKLKNDERHGRIQKKPDRRSSIPDGAIPIAERPPVHTGDLLEDTKRSLAAELENAERRKKQKDKFFNWHEDQAVIDRFEREQDKGLLDAQKQPKVPPVQPPQPIQPPRRQRGFVNHVT